MHSPPTRSPTIGAASQGTRLGLDRLFVRNRTFVFAGLAVAGPLAVRVAATHALEAFVLLFASAVLASFLLLRYTRCSIAIEDRINLRFGQLMPGRLFRVLLVLPPIAVAAFVVSVPAGIAICATFAAAGAQGAAARLAYRGIGDRATNAVLGYVVPLCLIALADGVDDDRWAWIGCVPLVMIFAFDVATAVWSDARGRFPRPGGVGMFFGTFNPVHLTHIAIIEAALRDRQLDRIYLHCTTVPKLHRDALAADEIRFEYRDGMRVYRKTKHADPNKNYFPTGNMFFEHRVRNALLKESIRDAGLEASVSVLDLPDLYEREGFLGIARHIRTLHPDMPCHGLHGSDTGGMWVRNIFEACGGVQPYAVRRRDNVSATAIRKGAVGLTTSTVERFLAAVREGKSFVFDDGSVFAMDDGAAQIAAAHSRGGAVSPVNGRN